MKYCSIVLFTLVVFLVSCIQDNNQVRQDGSPEGLKKISDASHEGDDGELGNPYFHFLEPMIKEASYEGVFDAGLSPVVEVCIFDESSGKCEITVAEFNTEAGHQSETIRMSETDEHYIVNWHTSDIDGYTPLDEGKNFRLQVLVDEKLMGYADVVFGANNKELKNVDTDEYIPLKEGRTLPIKFRIEEGALEWGNSRDFAAGGHHTCELVDTEIYCAGYNFFGAVGNGVVGPWNNPVPSLVVGGHSWKYLGPGQFHTCAIDENDEAWCWGRNQYGELGIGFRGGRYGTPQKVSSSLKFASISGGRHNTCAITLDGDGYCWGANPAGELGSGNTAWTTTPTAVTGSKTWKQIVPYDNHTCGITTSDVAYCWGSSSSGQTGLGYYAGAVANPALVSTTEKFETMAMGEDHSCGLANSGNAYCWGYNRLGNLGNAAYGIGSRPHTPVKVDGGPYIDMDESSYWNVHCALDASGAAHCWGHNNFGQLGGGYASPYSLTPIAVTGGHTFVEIYDSYTNSCGLDANGDIYCWGLNNQGVMGCTPSNAVYYTPVLSFTGGICTP